MGKAGRWIRNFLLGRREERDKKAAGPSFPVEAHHPLLVVSPPHSPKVRRRWSFKRSTSSRAAETAHCRSASLDSISIPKQPLRECHVRRRSHDRALMLNAHVAATKIQAAYRSYLARRALRALRGLVKLQALARGYLVRKRMNVVLRSINAVMKIQVRARIHRIQAVEEPPAMMRRRNSFRDSPTSDRREMIEKAAAGNDVRQRIEGLRSRSQHMGYATVERGNCGCKICSSDFLPALQREYKAQMPPSPSMLSFTASTSTTNDGHPEEYSPSMAQRNSRRYSSCSEHKHQLINLPANYSDCVPCGSDGTPNYMTNTKSSKAKARSHSEPRRRPKVSTRQRSRRTSSMDGKNDGENQYPWLIKLYRAGRSMTDKDSRSSISAVTSISNNRKSLIPFMPPMDIY